MRKNKKITYLLIALVGLIWGLVFYKVYSKFGGNGALKKNLSQPMVVTESVRSDSIYALLLNYPDPFLKGVGQLSDTPVKNSGAPKTIKWPPVEYRGLLTSNGKKESTGLLKVQTSNLLVKKGKIYAEIKIQAIGRDSIFLEYKNESRWIRIVK